LAIDFCAEIKEETMSNLQIYFSIHLVGMVILLGGALMLPIVLIPAIKSLDDAGQNKFMEIFGKRYSLWFTISAFLMVVTGSLQMFSPVLAEEMSGNTTLFLKHVVILPLIATGIYVWFILARKLGKQNEDRNRLMQQFVILSWVQAVLSVALLVITGILTG
jgi:uncharacterized membrane protein